MLGVRTLRTFCNGCDRHLAQRPYLLGYRAMTSSTLPSHPACDLWEFCEHLAKLPTTLFMTSEERINYRALIRRYCIALNEIFKCCYLFYRR